MEFYFSQICGLIVSAAAIASMQLKGIKSVLVCQLVCNGVGALSYILLGGFSGCGIYLVALGQSIVYFFFRLKDKKAPMLVAIGFILLYILCSVSTYQAPSDLISAAAALTCALSLIQEKPSVYRAFMLANGVIWMIYDVNLGAYTMILSHVATALSAGVGIVRLDILGHKRVAPEKENPPAAEQG